MADVRSAALLVAIGCIAAVTLVYQVTTAGWRQMTHGFVHAVGTPC